MTRTTVSAAKPDKTDTGEWIDIHSHVGRLMSRSWPEDGRSASTPRRPA
ncbi:MAG: hypothetical protein ACLS6O_00120 [Bifidobacterium sp.]